MSNNDLHQLFADKDAKKKMNKCKWVDNGECWHTACGHDFGFMTGGPDDNDFDFCPYCGLNVEEQ